MIIDGHVHLRYEGDNVIDLDALLESMRRCGIDQAIVIASPNREASTEKLLQTLAPHKGKLYLIGTLAPLRIRYPDKALLDQLERWLSSCSIVALKFYLGYQHYFPHNESLLGAYYELLEKYDRPAVFHTGDCHVEIGGAMLKCAHPLEIDQLAVQRPKLRIVMAHIGNPWTDDAAEVCYNKKNVYADCSGFVCGDFSEKEAARFARVVDHFYEWTESDDKLLFATDWPISNQDSYRAVIDRLHLSPERKEKLLWQNAKRVYRLPE